MQGEGLEGHRLSPQQRRLWMLSRHEWNQSYQTKCAVSIKGHLKIRHLKAAAQNLIARHEILCTLEDAVKAASQLVKQGGKVAFVHRPGRLMDMITLMRKYRLEPKRIQFVYPKQGKEANTLLIEAIKDGSPDLKILPPIIVYNEADEYTPEIRKILYGEE